MKKSITWCLILTKRQLKRPSLIAVLLCMVILSISMRVISKDVSASISVGFVTKDSSVKKSLLAHEGLLKFKEYNSDEALTKAVSAGSIQCGYLIQDDFTECIKEGENKDLIELVTSPDNIVSTLSNLVITATIIENTACELLIDDILNQSFFKNLGDEDVKQIQEYYNEFQVKHE